ncbi:MAG: site-specific DNA-methyltransferase, partial [Selenomonadaceae bacterium]|nr:site-specific DNA-methyltransferase [Selenomonadaceae bacterium]
TSLRTNLDKDVHSEVTAFGGKFKGNWRDGYNWERHGRLNAFGNVVGKRPSQVDYYIQEQTGYPSDVLEYKVPHSAAKLHPSQKPVDLLEFLIRTYTDEGETVLDATMGSGSTGVACVNTGRNFIGFETEKNFYDIALKRISTAMDKQSQELF